MRDIKTQLARTNQPLSVSPRGLIGPLPKQAIDEFTAIYRRVIGELPDQVEITLRATNFLQLFHFLSSKGER